LCWLFLSIPVVVISQEPDTTETTKIRAWTLTDLGLRDSVAMDTSLFDSHQYNPGAGQINLGHLASPMLHHLYHQRKQHPFLFLTPYQAYLKSDQRTRYINTRYPFTFLKYGSSTEKNYEDRLVVRHSQNVNEKLNVGLDLDLSASNKFYEDDRSLNGRFINIFGSYQTEPWSLYANVNINTINIQETGGISNRIDFEEDPKPIIPANLQDAKNVIRNRSFHLTQTLSLKKTSLSQIKLLDQIDQQTMRQQEDTISRPQPSDMPGDTIEGDSIRQDTLLPDTTEVTREDTTHSQQPADSLKKSDQTKFYLYHHLALRTNRKRFTQDNPLDEFYSRYPIFMDSTQTVDEARQRSIGNQFKLVYSNRFARVSTGMDHELIRYEYVRAQPDTGAPNYNLLNQRTYNNLALTASLNFHTDSSFMFDSRGKYYLSGFRGGDLLLYGTLRKTLGNNLLVLKGSYERYEPDYFFQHYNANHFRWDQELSKTREIEAEMQFHLNSWRTRFSFKPSLIRYFTYLDTMGRAAQYSGELQLLTASVEKDFQLWKFHSTNKVVFQYANPNDVLSLPTFYVYHRFAFRHRIHFRVTDGILDTQLGWSVYYTTGYNPDGYIPDLGMYHRQDDELLGNRPLFNLFANIQIKRTRLFVKFYHLNSFLLPRDYYTAPGYPRTPLKIKFGVSWSFYD